MNETITATGTLYTTKIESGSIGTTGYEFTIWTNVAQDEADFNVTVYGEDAAFKAEWNDSGDFLARVGLQWYGEEQKLYTEYGNIVAEYAYNKIPWRNCTRDSNGNCIDGGVAGDYSYIGVYGWALEDTNANIPLVEWYIVDDWFGNSYTNSSVNVQAGTICYDVSDDETCFLQDITVDGDVYHVYKHFRYGQASIAGDNTDFIQYFSVRNTPRQCGTISISQHFAEWEALGMRMGVMYEAKLLVEAGGGTGWIDYTYATVKANDQGNVNCTERELRSGNWPCGTHTDTIKCYLSVYDNTVCEDVCTGAHVWGDPVTGRCEILPCEKRTPLQGTSDGIRPCALDNDTTLCYADLSTDKCKSSCGPHYEENDLEGLCVQIPCGLRTPVGRSPPPEEESPPDFITNRDVHIQAAQYSFTTNYKCRLWIEYTVNGVPKHSTLNDDGCQVAPWVASYPSDETVLVWNNVPADRLDVLIRPVWEVETLGHSGGSETVSIAHTQRVVGGGNPPLPTDFTSISIEHDANSEGIWSVETNVLVLVSLQDCPLRHPNSTVALTAPTESCSSSFETDKQQCVPYGHSSGICFIPGGPEENDIAWPCGLPAERCYRDSGGSEDTCTEVCTAAHYDNISAGPSGLALGAAQTGRCTLKPCEERTPDEGGYWPCGYADETDHCFGYASASPFCRFGCFEFSKNREFGICSIGMSDGCNDENHKENGPNGCQDVPCDQRTPTAEAAACGSECSENLGRNLNPLSGETACALNCSNPHFQPQDSTAKCVVLPCDNRIPIEGKDWPCGVFNEDPDILCYENVGRSTTEKPCSLACSNQHFTNENTDAQTTGRCAPKDCAARTPVNPEEEGNWSCLIAGESDLCYRDVGHNASHCTPNCNHPHFTSPPPPSDTSLSGDCTIIPCGNRNPVNGINWPCGVAQTSEETETANCYQDIGGEASGTCVLACTNLHYESTSTGEHDSPSLTGKCKALPCEDRSPADGRENWACGTPEEGCYQDIGHNSSRCTSVCNTHYTPNDAYPYVSEEARLTGKCTIVPCAKRIPVLEGAGNWPCGDPTEAYECYFDPSVSRCVHTCTNTWYHPDNNTGNCTFIIDCEDRSLRSNVEPDTNEYPDFVKRVDVHAVVSDFDCSAGWKCNPFRVEVFVNGEPGRNTTANPPGTWGDLCKAGAIYWSFSNEPEMVWTSVPTDKLSLTVKPQWEKYGTGTETLDISSSPRLFSTDSLMTLTTTGESIATSLTTFTTSPHNTADDGNDDGIWVINVKVAVVTVLQDCVWRTPNTAATAAGSTCSSSEEPVSTTPCVSSTDKKFCYINTTDTTQPCGSSAEGCFQDIEGTTAEGRFRCARQCTNPLYESTSESARQTGKCTLIETQPPPPPDDNDTQPDNNDTQPDDNNTQPPPPPDEGNSKGLSKTQLITIIASAAGGVVVLGIIIVIVVVVLVVRKGGRGRDATKEGSSSDLTKEVAESNDASQNSSIEEDHALRNRQLELKNMNEEADLHGNEGSVEGEEK